MSDPIDRLVAQLPLEWQEYAPRFILFMQKYYEWMFRTGGFTKEEVEFLRADTSWVKNDVDLFVKTGLLKYTDINSTDIVDRAIIQLGNIPSPGAHSDALADNILMEEVFQEFVTADDEYITDASGIILDTHKLYDEIVDGWFDSMNSNRVINDKFAGNTVDPVLMITLLKHMNGIKGTDKSIKLFFNLYFNEEVEVYQPKFDIAIIDDNFIPDVHGIIRDDYYYNEYSYVIRVQNDISTYETIFNDIYLKNVHPAGFKVFLEKI